MQRQVGPDPVGPTNRANRSGSSPHSPVRRAMLNRWAVQNWATLSERIRVSSASAAWRWWRAVTSSARWIARMERNSAA